MTTSLVRLPLLALQLRWNLLRDMISRWRIGAPIIGLIGLIACSGFLLLADIASGQDKDFAKTTQGNVRHAMEGLISSNAKIATEYSIWDDAYENITLDFNPEWLASNFYSTNSSAVLVVRPGEGLRHSYVKPEIEARRTEIEAFVKGLTLVRKEKTRGVNLSTFAFSGWSGFKVVDGKLASVAIQLLRPEPGSDIVQRDLGLPVDFTVVITFIEAPALATIARTFSLDDLNLSLDPQAVLENSNDIRFPITGVDREALGWVTWANPRPGTQAFVSRMFPIMIVLLVVGILTIYVTQKIVTRDVRLVEEAKAAAESANAAKSSFLDNVSHELRTPLNAIIGFSDVIQEECQMLGNDVTAKDAKKINNSAHYLLGLINDLLDHSKIEAGKMDIVPVLVDLEPVVTSVAETLQNQVEHNNSKLVVLCDRELGSAFVDDMRLKQCLLNLVSNAAKFTSNGTVTLAARPVELDGQPFLRFTVKDTGIGMNAQTLAKLFTPFTQGEETTARKFGGTGLGLVITRKLAEAMGGRVDVESTEGVGSMFTLLLPRGKAWDRVKPADKQEVSQAA